MSTANSRYSAAYSRRWPARRLVQVAKSRAKKRGIVFSLTYEDVPSVPAVCPVLGMPLVLHAGEGRQGGWPDSPSLDRIDPAKGYVKGNVRVISHLANSMKASASPEQLKRFATWVVNNHA